MKEALTTNQVVIVLVEHPVLGLLLVPYTVGRALDNTLEVIEQASVSYTHLTLPTIA
mgnify:CR=1 FL=1